MTKGRCRAMSSRDILSRQTPPAAFFYREGISIKNRSPFLPRCRREAGRRPSLTGRNRSAVGGDAGHGGGQRHLGQLRPSGKRPTGYQPLRPLSGTGTPSVKRIGGSPGQLRRADNDTAIGLGRRIGDHNAPVLRGQGKGRACRLARGVGHCQRVLRRAGPGYCAIPPLSMATRIPPETVQVPS